jgi:hypothetical protein
LVGTIGIVLHFADDPNVFECDRLGPRTRQAEFFLPSADNELEKLAKEPTDGTDEMEYNFKKDEHRDRAD